MHNVGPILPYRVHVHVHANNTCSAQSFLQLNYFHNMFEAYVCMYMYVHAHASACRQYYYNTLFAVSLPPPFSLRVTGCWCSTISLISLNTVASRIFSRMLQGPEVQLLQLTFSLLSTDAKSVAFQKLFKKKPDNFVSWENISSLVVIIMSSYLFLAVLEAISYF